ncbi:MAG: LytTR family DNA-binding domain-containing protein [Methylotenera sp.]
MAASPASSTTPRSPTSRRTGTTPGCTPRRAAHLVRTPLSTLEEEWAPAGFVRIHRSLLVSLAHIDEIRMDGGRCSVRRGRTRARRARRQPPAHPRAPRPAAAPSRAREHAGERRGPPATGPGHRTTERRRTPHGAHPATSTPRPGWARCCMGSLLRAQLRLALAGAGGARRDPGPAAGALPARALPGRGRASWDVPLAWLVLGVLVYPFLVLLGWVYVRRAESNERDFAELVGDAVPTDPEDDR